MIARGAVASCAAIRRRVVAGGRDGAAPRWGEVPRALVIGGARLMNDLHRREEGAIATRTARRSVEARTRREKPCRSSPVEVEYCSACAVARRSTARTRGASASSWRRRGGRSVCDEPPVAAPAAEGDAPAAEGEEKKEGGKKKKEKKAKGVTITRTTRNKKKTITNVAGLEHYPEVKIAECAKTLGKKFACGASVTKGPTGKDEIDVQGDFSHEIADLLAEKFGVDRETTKVVDKGRH